MLNPSINIVPISPEHRDEAIEILSLSFWDDPVLRYFFSDFEATYEGHLRTLFELCYDWPQVSQWTFIGVEQERQLVAVACITEPENQPNSTLLAEAEQVLLAAFGETVAARIQHYTKTKAAYFPQKPHFYLNMLGVHPKAQGKGVGRTVLDWLYERSQAHATSVGIDLDTGTPTNVAIYERCGYQITATTQLGNVPIWYMFQSNQTNAICKFSID